MRHFTLQSRTKKDEKLYGTMKNWKHMTCDLTIVIEEMEYKFPVAQNK